MVFLIYKTTFLNFYKYLRAKTTRYEEFAYFWRELGRDEEITF